MQLKAKAGVSATLAAATCSLLASAPGVSIAAEREPWQFDAGVLYYGESSRVTDASATFLASKGFSLDRRLTVRFSIDSLTGASASGAVPARFAQTFTTPSGNDTYTIDPRQTPLDPTFLDTRVALTAGFGMRAGRNGNVDFGVSLSDEYDYFHAGANVRYSRELRGGNTTLNVGLAFASDSIEPVGGTPARLAQMLPEGDLGNRLGDESKTVADLVLGVVQVLGPRTIGQFNYSLSQVDGYQSDPYKLVTLVDPITGDPVPSGSPDLNTHYFDTRPESRTKHSIYAEVKHAFGRDMINGSYRYHWDDWGVASHTADLRYRFRLKHSYFEPHLRYYMQEAADFYAPVLFDGTALPTDVSADYRLGDLDTVTLGLKYARPLERQREWSVRVEYYQQSGNSPPGFQAIGSLADLELFPEVEAVIVQAGYSF